MVHELVDPHATISHGQRTGTQSPIEVTKSEHGRQRRESAFPNSYLLQ
jgi:hypothetical protein